MARVERPVARGASRALDGARKTVHDERMARNAALTIRLPASLKRRLEARAASRHRSLSAQVVADLERVSDEPKPSSGVEGRFLGHFAGSPMPSDEDLAEVRRLLWGRIGRHAQRP